jgi:hypothetical protein
MSLHLLVRVSILGHLGINNPSRHIEFGHLGVVETIEPTRRRTCFLYILSSTVPEASKLRGLPQQRDDTNDFLPIDKDILRLSVPIAPEDGLEIIGRVPTKGQ